MHICLHIGEIFARIMRNLHFFANILSISGESPGILGELTDRMGIISKILCKSGYILARSCGVISITSISPRDISKITKDSRKYWEEF